MIVIVNYGMGNLHSVLKKLRMCGVDAFVSDDLNVVLNASKIILPGVGHFAMAMDNLKNLNLIETLNECALVKKTPMLGICLGMQLMASRSEEGSVSGLGWFDAEVVRFKIQDTLKYKIPHTGWNQISIEKESPLMKNIESLSSFYFVHSYHWKTEIKTDILTTSEYEYRFVSAVEKNNIFGVQFHPEKSHDVGEVLFRNFLKI
ncbi:MAG: imidazole glycerol phosphate synthase, glutamine amidotransferase subunit [Bacteroidetes bacterium GWF2_43_63]|nr:MAG: imidazole glycerol phosphate synthase, glutamine amidotransferase subunit [Bacteroidetes bacterium GWE2_42_42]OFY52984.1 MAG: imidazole glycerol phosphate synthase, glutamine amidotransferase subunit [Bacteroidetes bacterium GWF2_43_63]HBG70200.1 imidazole glycerol phosphate synthase subunit HisH [Bacteroidales bacterium]HCB62192.1 imidazole glycerol phosphate synthase subunit HisH [Bacteroidales bacterium]